MRWCSGCAMASMRSSILSNQRRLREIDDTQMGEVAARIQKFMPHIAPAWKPADVEALISLWSKLR